MTRFGRFAAALIGAAALALGAVAATAEDRHAGYYYPKPQSQEDYKARSRVLPDTNKTARINFVTAITNKMIQANYPPPYAIFAKGTEAEKLIIVTLSDTAFNTLYRGRALFAMLSAQARTTPIFRQHKVEAFFTFFDLINMMGFKQITVSDGRTYAHQVFLK